jgi:hypothetical protein
MIATIQHARPSSAVLNTDAPVSGTLHIPAEFRRESEKQKVN